MEWNLSSLPDANFAGEEWRNLHRNCVPIASLENLEFSSVLLRFPFFFFVLLKRFSQIVRFLPSFLLEHCGYRRCLNVRIRRERKRIWIERGSKKGSFRFFAISNFFYFWRFSNPSILAIISSWSWVPRNRYLNMKKQKKGREFGFLKSFNSCHHFFFHCGYHMFERENTKGKNENLDRKRIEKRIVSILCNLKIFFWFWRFLNPSILAIIFSWSWVPRNRCLNTRKQKKGREFG